MFGLGLKKRTAEAIRRGIRASLLGGYLHPSTISKLDLNDDASAWILTESYAHHLFALSCVFSNSCAGDKWATFDFFTESVIDGMKESQQLDGGPEVDTLAPILIKRFEEIQTMSEVDRLAKKHFDESANLAVNQDQSADVDEISKLLRETTMRYMQDVNRMFNS